MGYAISIKGYINSQPHQKTIQYSDWRFGKNPTRFKGRCYFNDLNIFITLEIDIG
jgi:hypothetical protein